MNHKRCLWYMGAFPGGSDGKESTCNAGDPDLTLGQENPLEEGMSTHSSILAWRISWTEEPGGLQPMELQRVRHDRLFLTLGTVAQAPLSERFSRQQYWSGLPFPPPGDLPDLGIESGFLPCRQILYSLRYQVGAGSWS